MQQKKSHSLQTSASRLFTCNATKLKNLKRKTVQKNCNFIFTIYGKLPPAQPFYSTAKNRNRLYRKQRAGYYLTFSRAALSSLKGAAHMQQFNYRTVRWASLLEPVPKLLGSLGAAQDVFTQLARVCNACNRKKVTRYKRAPAGYLRVTQRN